MFGDTVPSELPDKWAMSIRQPIGVAGIITPWNFPIAIPCWKMMPALVTGNTVVFKPASRHAALRDAPRRADGRGRLPAGHRQPRHRVRRRGRRRDRRAARTSPVISFTGTRRPGKRIAERAGRAAQARSAWSSAARTRSSCCADADLDLAVDGILWSAFGTTGQRCTACSRVIVERAVADALVERLETRARALRLGRRPRCRRPTSGRSSTRRRSTRSSGYVEIGRREGELVMRRRAGRPAATSSTATSSSRRSSPASRPMDRIAQEEIFGPVLSVIPVDDYDAAVDGASTRPATACRRRSTPAT